MAMHLYNPLRSNVRLSCKPYRTASPVRKRTAKMVAQFDAVV